MNTRMIEIITLLCDGIPSDMEQELIDFLDSIESRIGKLEKATYKEKEPVREFVDMIDRTGKREKCDVIVLEDDGEID